MVHSFSYNIIAFFAKPEFSGSNILMNFQMFYVRKQKKIFFRSHSPIVIMYGMILLVIKQLMRDKLKLMESQFQ